MMNSSINKIIFLPRKHWGAILFSILIGFVVAGPQIWFIYSLGNNYRGIHMTGADAELHYLARMKEVVEGGGLGNPFIYEYKNNVPSTTYTISEAVLAWPAKVLNISIQNINLFYKFLLPIIIALLVYGLTYRLIGSRLWSISSMAMIVLGSTLVNFPDIMHLLRWEKVYTQFVTYSRPVNPELSSILFFAYLHVLLTALRKKTWNWFILLGILFGLSFYIYLYSYTFFLALNFVVLFICLIKKERKTSIGILSASTMGVAIGSFSIMNTINLYAHPYFKSMAVLSDIVSSHHPIVSTAGIITLIVFLAFLFKHKNYLNLTFLGALLVTSFVVINQQIITGVLVQEGHYHWYFNTPIFMLILVVAGYYLVGRKHQAIGITVAVFLCAISLVNAVLIQTSSYEHLAIKTRTNQKYMAVLDWIRIKTPKGSVIMANQSLSEIVPVYTSANVVWEDHASYYLLPQERRDFTPDKIMTTPDLNKALSKYRVDYLVWDSVKEPKWELDRYSFLNKLYDDGEFKIYGR